ncbi:MAG: C_GCAxxG_C_C family protein [Oscillospiraceae bacterium]|nr:C_GCAxxG_C_C family protein [Oscillospiraceae bacterium]
MDRAETAVQRKRSCNCCQAVLLAYADKLGMEEAQLLKLGAAFGAGMGGMQGTCGALVGAEMVLGLLGGSMAKARALHQDFTQRCGASLCKDLKGIGTGKVLCPCDECVRNAVLALEAGI